LSDNNSGRITSSVRNVVAQCYHYSCESGTAVTSCWVAKYSLAVKENKGPFFRLRREYKQGHHTQHFSKHLSPQLLSSLTSVTRESSAMCRETKDVLMTGFAVIRLPCLKRNDGNLRHPSAMCWREKHFETNGVTWQVPLVSLLSQIKWIITNTQERPNAMRYIPAESSLLLWQWIFLPLFGFT
jgi:hypothetical protein